MNTFGSKRPAIKYQVVMLSSAICPLLGAVDRVSYKAANPLDKFEIPVLLADDVVRHLPKRKLGRYARLSASFFRLTLGMSPQWLLWAKW